MKDWLIKKLGGYSQLEWSNLCKLRDQLNKQQYDCGFADGLKKGKEKLKRTPGWLKQEVHRKLDLMFKKDSFSDRARYRWLKQHSLTTSHMSEMSYDELSKINKLLDETIGSEVVQ